MTASDGPEALPTDSERCEILGHVVGTRPVSLFDRSWFYANGQDPRQFNLVVVKSPHCEPHMFAAWCAKLINVDAPGSTSANLKSLGHTACPRPIFPLDDAVELTPMVEVFGKDVRVPATRT